MQAIIQNQYGSPAVLSLTSIPKPQPKKNELLIRIAASSVTAADTMMRKGIPRFGRLFLGLTKPRYPIPGTGFSGVVESVGSDVSRFDIGDSVLGESILGFGTNCEYVCVPEDGVVVHKPPSISHAEAAPVCDGAVTAYNFIVRLGEVKPGTQVLINGAAGSLGSAAVQIAKQAGAIVTGVSSTHNVDFVRSMGADRVIDYTTETVLDGKCSYDVIFDSVGMLSYRDCSSVLQKDGRYLSPVLGIPLLFHMLTTKLIGGRRALFSATGLLPGVQRLQMLKQLVKCLTTGQLRTHIDREYSIDQIAAAHRYVDTGHKRANIVITMPVDEIR